MRFRWYALHFTAFLTIAIGGKVQASFNKTEQEKPQKTFFGRARLSQMPTASSSQGTDVSETSFDQTAPRFILSIDGGGIRGIIPAEILSYVEEKLNKTIQQRVSNRIQHQLGKPFKEELALTVPLAHAFDMMAGTSVGGIIVLGLSIPDLARPSYPRYQVQTLLNLQKDFGREVFSPTEKQSLFMSLFKNRFDTKGLERLLEEYFGTVSLKQALGSVIVPAYELRQEQLYLFKSQAAKQSIRDDFLIRDAARATSAAPTYLSAANFKNQAQEEHLFVDGGIVSNNPAMAAFMQALEQFPHARSLTLLSLGTGRAPHDQLSKLKKGGLLGWGPAIASVMIDGTTEFTHDLLQSHQGRSGTTPALKYVRIQTPLSKTRAEMDNVTEDNLLYLSALARRTIKSHKKELLSFIEDLADAYEAKGHFLSPVLEKALTNSPVKASLTTSLQLANQGLKVLDAWDLCHYVQRQKPPFTLVALNLQDNSLTDDGVTLLGSALSHLMTLNIKNNHLSAVTLHTLGEHAPLLTELNIGRNSVASHLEALSALKHLRRLDVSEIDLDDQHLQTLVNSVPALVALHANNNYRLQDGALLIQKLVYLNELSLARTSAAASIIKALKGPQSLTLLDLSHTRFNDENAQELSTVLKQNHHLQRLTLYYNNITDKGAQSFADALRENTTLVELNLKNNGIAAQGLTALGGSLCENTSLRTLNLSRNLYDEPALSEFYTMLLDNAGLQTISVEHTNTGKAAAALKKLRQERRALTIEENQARGTRE